MARETCTVEGCERFRLGKSPYCKMHKVRWERHGDPTVVKHKMRESRTANPHLGLRCPECSGATDVVDSRQSGPEAIRRRRRCMDCAHTFTTLESVSALTERSANAELQRVVRTLEPLLARLKPQEEPVDGL